MRTPSPLGFTKGIDRTLGPLQADKGSFYILRNLRHSFFQRGVIEQTPYWYDYSTFAQGTYYDGGSQTEAATSGVRLITSDLVVTDYVCRGPSGQLQVFYQTCDAATETDIHFGCRLVINSITALGITLGSNIEVDIDGATTFRWRKNGGAYTSLVPITTAGVSIDGGNATVYFLTDTGFTIGTTWLWTRTDASFASNSGTFGYPCDYQYYKGELYFNSVDDRLMVCSESSTGNYVISVGYRPVVGGQLCFFDDHLIVGQFRRGTTGWTGVDRWYTVGWSDKTDIHNFISTDTNEADQYALPNNNRFDDIDAAESYIMGVAGVQGQLYVFTTNEIYVTTALGLPIVFSFQKIIDLKIAGAYLPIIPAEQGVYILGHSDVFFFDGSNLRSIGAPVVQGTPNGNFEDSFGVWDPFRKELVFVLETLLFCYQEKWGTWYVRLADFDSQTQPVKSISSYSGQIAVGIKSIKLRREDATATVQPIFDDSSGTVYAEPYLLTQIFGEDLAIVKELVDFYLGAITNSSGVSATYYTTSTGLTIQLSYWLTPGGDFTNASETTPSGATWTSAKADGRIDVRTPFRGIAIALEVQGTASKPPAFVTIQQIIPVFRNKEERSVVK